ncbi:hypothetical protein B0I35DRAFT_415392 [Stachybotrys elegans]|uniref:Uncharacterized protein n=1 Tax=Stachybotrys elegans TaxID=80388 RepID=A0A8K0SB39_9HYPO|nr:hypothetical protein B0I35DRAFT_415392 [Stachybotrys elegans]
MSNLRSDRGTGGPPNSALAATAWQQGGIYNIVLAYQTPDGSLSFTRTQGLDPAEEASWSDPQRLSPEFPPDDGTPMAMSSLPQTLEATSSQRYIQVELFFLNETSRLNGLNYNVGRSKLALVPISRNATRIRYDGWWAVLYQAEGGNLVAIVNPTGQNTGSLGELSDLWTSNDSADIRQAWFDTNHGGWQTSSPENLRGADEGTSITCITAPTWENMEGLGELQLASASELTRCYFHKDAGLKNIIEYLWIKADDPAAALCKALLRARDRSQLTLEQLPRKSYTDMAFAQLAMT